MDIMKDLLREQEAIIRVMEKHPIANIEACVCQQTGCQSAKVVGDKTIYSS